MVDKLIECQFDKCTEILKDKDFFLLTFSENILRFLGSKISKYQKNGLMMFFTKLNYLCGSAHFYSDRLNKLIQSMAN